MASASGAPRATASEPNFLKYPVQEAVNMSTGEFKLVNVLTGEVGYVTVKDGA